MIGDTGDASGADIFAVMLALVLFGYGLTLGFGVPLHLLLRRFHKTDLGSCLSLTALPIVLLAGGIAMWLRLAPAPAPPVNPFGLYMQGGLVIRWVLAFAAMASLLVGTFWYAAVRQPKI